MVYLEKFRKHNHVLLSMILLLASASIVLNFISAPQARTFFYLTSYVAIFSLLINWNQKPTPLLILIVAVLALVGLSKYIWFLIEYVGNPAYNQYNPYYNTGKRLLLSAVIAWSVFSLREHMTEQGKKIIKISIFTAFLIASVIGFYQSIHFPKQRVDFFLGFATDSAYMYSAISLLTILLLDRNKNMTSKFLMPLFFVISMFITFKTETRNVLIFFPLALVISFSMWRKNHIKIISSLIVAIVISFILGYKPFIEKRVAATQKEIASYQKNNGNTSGSLTARFAMWDVGYHAFITHPWGMSFEQRAKFAKKYAKDTKSNKSALHYINIHLHNELMDTATLQGILGIVVILFAYLALLYYSIRNRNSLVLGLTLIIMTVGLTDVIFISREQTIFFSLLFIMIISLTTHDKKSNTEKE